MEDSIAASESQRLRPGIFKRVYKAFLSSVANLHLALVILLFAIKSNYCHCHPMTSLSVVDGDGDRKGTSF